MAHAAGTHDQLGTVSTEEFEAWMDLVYTLRDEVGAEVGLRPIDDRDGPFVVQTAQALANESRRREQAISEWTARVLTALNSPAVLDRSNELTRKYRILENIVGPDAARWHLRDRIIASLKDTYSFEQWCHGRLLALLIQRIVVAADDRELSEWVVRAYLNGINIHVYPQWRPYFHKHVFLFSDGHWLAKCGKFGRGVQLAADLNETFFRFALLGELNAFILLTRAYARQLRDLPLQRQVGFLSAAFSEIAREVGDAFDATVSQAPDPVECEVLLESGASSYCRRLLDFRWGRSERGLPQVTDWSDFLGWCFPVTHESPEVLRVIGPHVMAILESQGGSFAIADSPDQCVFLGQAPSGRGAEIANHYITNGLHGLLGGVLGCEFLLRQLAGREDKSAFMHARATFLELVKEPLATLREDVAAGPGGSLARSIVTAISGEAQ